ncbi:hypothetical protein VNO78_20455 [Psophocarpus tetragonolobus]|uniref:Uncharacterized protein n=1 Tax=Psophocarpus tetragonolobus TaxID=3891 RepID=A0AAN9S9F9_PSOTE
MGKSCSLTMMLICATTVLVAMSRWPTAMGGGDHHLGMGWVPMCKGSIAECLGLGGEEYELDSETNRRILATSRYISYGALQRNTVPCSRRGASYYNCRPGAQANPYSRGCNAITRSVERATHCGPRSWLQIFGPVPALCSQLSGQCHRTVVLYLGSRFFNQL